MRYREFLNLLIGIVGYETAISGTTNHRIGILLDAYGLPFKRYWEENALADLNNDARIQMYRHIGPMREQTIMLTGDGTSWFEDEFEENAVQTFEAYGIRNPHQEPGLNVNEAPASDRMVSLDHNLEAYSKIASGLATIKEAVRSANDIEVEPEERDRIFRSLEAAQSLWSAAQLNYLQIKVGVLMAAEDAAKVLAGTAKAVASALLVDAIKAFVKGHAGLDLDSL